MATLSFSSKDIDKTWWVVDANGKTLGRLATQIALHLRGKHKPEYTPHADVGDFVVVVNADKVAVTGKKETDKIYWRHTGFPGGIKGKPLGKMREERPEKIIETAVKGMLPKNPLGRAMYKKLKVYKGDTHPHAAQQPQTLEL
jgi:large subunit ribosomal protein L13